MQARGAECGAEKTGWVAAPAIWSNNVLISAVSARRARSVRFGTGQTEYRGYITLDVRVDPKAEYQLHGINLTAVTDDKGNSLLITRERNADDFLGHSGQNCEMPIKDLPTGGDRIAVVRGAADILLYRRENWEIRNPAGEINQTRTTSCGKYTVVSVQKLGADKYQLEARYVESAFRSGRPANHAPVLQDSGGREWDSIGWLVGGPDESTTATLRRPEGAADPVKLVWSIPVKARQVTVPFEFKDLPLP